jgi:hypothetical protein
MTPRESALKGGILEDLGFGIGCTGLSRREEFKVYAELNILVVTDEGGKGRRVNREV